MLRDIAPILGDCRFIRYFPRFPYGWIVMLYQPEIPLPISPRNVESRNLAFRFDECPIKKPVFMSWLWRLSFLMGNWWQSKGSDIWVCLKMVSTPKPHGFADHYPVFKWLAIIGKINPTFSGPNPHRFFAVWRVNSTLPPRSRLRTPRQWRFFGVAEAAVPTGRRGCGWRN